MSTFTGQPVQPQKFGVPHTFQDGMNADYAPEGTPATGYVNAGNAHLLRHLGSEVLFMTDTDTVQRTSLPDNHVIMGWASRNGVLYLVLGEVINGIATGRGEIGTFPAPNYAYVTPSAPTSALVTTGALVQQYRALHVYLGDNLPYAKRPGPMSSLRFNFELSQPVEVVLQPSYDGSVNILVHDRGHEAPLLINSGFRVSENNTYELIKRNGKVSTNLYNGSDFKGRLQQQLMPQTAGKLRLKEVGAGGKLLGGEYRYYLLYCDADNNQTGVAAEVGPVFVFNSVSPGASHGALPDENSGRRVVLQASGLDPALGYVRLAWVRRSGEPSAVASSATRTTERFSIPESGIVDFLHTGFETQVTMSIEELLNLDGQVYRYGTAAATEQGRLLVGNVQTNAGTDPIREALRDYARTCKLGHSMAQMHEPGLSHATGVSIPELYTNTSQQTVQLDTFSGGSSNPLNLCYRLGYHDAEAYSWCLQGQMLDGTVTNAYPVKGIDNLTGLQQYVSDAAPDFYDELGWSSDRKQNIAGVYRFPRRGKGSTMPMVDTGGNVNILRAELQMPAMPALLAKNLRCLRIVRAPRRENRRFQGYMIPTMRMLVSGPSGDGYDGNFTEMNDVYAGNTLSNLKVVPAPQLTLEASFHDYNNSGKERVSSVFPFRFYPIHLRNGEKRKTYDEKRYALYSPDMYLQMPNIRQDLNANSWQVLPVALVNCWREGQYQNPIKSGRSGGSWSIYKTATQTLLPNEQIQTVRLHATGDKQAVPNTGRFGSVETSFRGVSSTYEYYLLRMAWEEYVGVEYTSAPPARTQLNLTQESPSVGDRSPTGYDLTTIFTQAMADPASPLALLVDVYGPEGVWDAATVRQAYPIDNTPYFPISDWLTPQELDNSLLDGRVLPLYGGDAVVGLSFRRVMRSISADDTSEELAAISQAMGMVTSSTVNSWARSTESTTVNSFLPYLGSESGDINQFRTFPYNTIKESLRYNAGYTQSVADTPPLVTSTRDNTGLVPFARTLFPQRIWSTPVATESALSNGWRHFAPFLFKDYDVGGGTLVRIMSGPRSEVLLVYENALAVINLNERAITGSEAGRPVYTASQGLFPERATVIATDLGCQHAFALDVSDEGVYGYDALHNAVWRYTWGAGKAFRLSDQRVSSLLKPASEKLLSLPVVLLNQDVRVTFDPFRKDVIVTMYSRKRNGLSVGPQVN